MRLRGRKGIRETLEQQSELVVLEPEHYKGKWTERFPAKQPLQIELGMGKGRFIHELSKLHPGINFIGLDKYDELLRRAADLARSASAIEADEANSFAAASSNLQLVRADVETIEEIFAQGEVARIYLNFSDPWPKSRHARRRLTHPRFLEKYMHILAPNGEIHFKTDSRSLFEFSLNAFADMGFKLRNISLHLHEDGPAPGHVMTEYEQKFTAQGMPIYRCEAVTGAHP